MATGIEDDNHALLVGMVAGALMKAGADITAFVVKPEADEDGNWTNQITVARPSGTYTVTVTKDPELGREGTHDCPGCGAPEGYPPAGPCDGHGTPEAVAIADERGLTDGD